MHVLGIVGSARKDRHTNTLVNRVIGDMRSYTGEVSAEIVHTAAGTFQPCRVVCSDYCSTHPYCCSISDGATDVLDRMTRADALVIGAPQYFRAPPAGFHAMIERLQAMFFFQETRGRGDMPSPVAGKPCGLVAVAEYSNPHAILEYLHDFCTLLKMRPVLLDTFPYLGVAGQGDIENDEIFRPFERSKDLARALVEQVRSRTERGAKTQTQTLVSRDGRAGVVKSNDR